MSWIARQCCNLETQTCNSLLTANVVEHTVRIRNMHVCVYVFTCTLSTRNGVGIYYKLVYKGSVSVASGEVKGKTKDIPT